MNPTGSGVCSAISALLNIDDQNIYYPPLKEFCEANVGRANQLLQYLRNEIKSIKYHDNILVVFAFLRMSLDLAKYDPNKPI